MGAIRRLTVAITGGVLPAPDGSLPTPWQGIQFVKVETVASPSWVSWKEIEIIAP